MDQDTTVALLGAGSTLATVEFAAYSVDLMRFEDHEIAAIAQLGDELRLQVIAKIVEAANTLREAARALDGRVLQLRGITVAG